MTAATRPPEAAARGTEGTGRAACHHGEILQGVFLDERRRTVHALVTPMNGPGSTARFAHRPGSSPDEVTVTPAGRTGAGGCRTRGTGSAPHAGDAEPCGGELTLTGGPPSVSAWAPPPVTSSPLCARSPTPGPCGCRRGDRPDRGARRRRQRDP
ncbi:hypothetical protein LV779_35075 [Streptomyces thinghirensis]|nr:hypothetical protein [Streptomyces thinghirensis]